LRNVIERAAIIFPKTNINAKNIKENLLKVNLPDSQQEKEKLWEMTTDLSSVDVEISNDSISMPHPNHYKKWFDLLDKIDLRRHLSDVEFNLIEGALKRSDASVTDPLLLFKAPSIRLNSTSLKCLLKSILSSRSNHFL
jgi:DNA-binding NtrC family response regulator